MAEIKELFYHRSETQQCRIRPNGNKKVDIIVHGIKFEGQRHFQSLHMRGQKQNSH